jgi:neutral ceramidase
MPSLYPFREGLIPRRRHLFTVLSLASLLAFCLLALASLILKRSEEHNLRLKYKTPLEKRANTGDKYLLGVGKADVTGPVVEINLAGYADLAQSGSGLRQRLYSRAFIVGELDKPANRHIYIVLDTQAGDTAIRYGILEKLASMGSEYSVYGSHNIAVTGTHSHAGPGGWFNYLLPQVTSLGFVRESYQAIVDGAVLCIKRAHESLTEVSLLSLEQVFPHAQDSNEYPLSRLEGLSRFRHHGNYQWRYKPQPLVVPP